MPRLDRHQIWLAGQESGNLQALELLPQTSPPRTKRDDPGIRRPLAVARPGVHQTAALVERVAAPLGALDLVADQMRQGGFRNVRSIAVEPLAERVGVPLMRCVGTGPFRCHWSVLPHRTGPFWSGTVQTPPNKGSNLPVSEPFWGAFMPGDPSECRAHAKKCAEMASKTHTPITSNC
jgi:hypothetical protein